MTKNKWITFATALLLTPTLGCVPIDEGDDNTNGGGTGGGIIDAPRTVAGDTVWEAGTYILPREFYVEGTLTIAPCTEVRVNDRFWVRNGGNIVAIGDDDCPIVFTSTSANPSSGDWRFIDIQETAGNDNVFEHVVFEYGGNRDGALQVRSRTAFRDVALREINEQAIRVFDEARLTDFSNISFDSVEGYPLVITPNEVAAIDGITTSNVTNNAIRIQGGELTRNSVWTAQSIPYEFSGNFNSDYYSSAALRLEEGVRLKLATGFRLFIRDNGSLHTEGTAENPVIIESLRSSPEAGDWAEISLANSADSSSFTWTTIRHGGRNSNGAIETNVSITLDNVIFENNANCDLKGSESNITATNTTFEAC